MLETTPRKHEKRCEFVTWTLRGSTFGALREKWQRQEALLEGLPEQQDFLFAPQPLSTQECNYTHTHVEISEAWSCKTNELHVYRPLLLLQIYEDVESFPHMKFSTCHQSIRSWPNATTNTALLGMQSLISPLCHCSQLKHIWIPQSGQISL